MWGTEPRKNKQANPSAQKYLTNVDREFVSFLQNNESKQFSDTDIVRHLIFFMKKYDQTKLSQTVPPENLYVFAPNIIQALGRCATMQPPKIDSNDFINLQYTMRQLSGVFIVPKALFSNGVEKIARESNIMKLTVFANVRKLVLWRVKPNLIVDFSSISMRLEEVHVYEILNSLEELFGISEGEQAELIKQNNNNSNNNNNNKIDTNAKDNNNSTNKIDTNAKDNNNSTNKIDTNAKGNNNSTNKIDTNDNKNKNGKNEKESNNTNKPSDEKTGQKSLTNNLEDTSQSTKQKTGTEHIMDDSDLTLVSEHFEKEEMTMIELEAHYKNQNVVNWKNLRVLNCSNNNIPLVDHSLHHLHSVEKINLSSNLLTKIQNFQYCYQLVWLDLSYNMLSDLSNIFEFLGNLKFLFLAGNRITSVKGVEKLMSLELCDFSKNQIDSLSDIFILKGLPFLQSVGFAGNPFSQEPNYRTTLFSNFSPKLRLDGTHPTSEELKLLEKESEITAKLIQATTPEIRIKTFSKPKPKERIQRVAEIDESSPTVKNPNQKMLSPHPTEETPKTLGKTQPAPPPSSSSSSTEPPLMDIVTRYQNEYGKDWLIYLADELERREAKAKKNKPKKQKKRTMTDLEIKKDWILDPNSGAQAEPQTSPSSAATSGQEKTNTSKAPTPLSPDVGTLPQGVKVELSQERLVPKDTAPSQPEPLSSPEVHPIPPLVIQPPKKTQPERASSIPMSIPALISKIPLPFPSSSFEPDKIVSEVFSAQVLNKTSELFRGLDPNNNTDHSIDDSQSQLYEDRMLAVQNGFIEEADVYSGSTIQRLELRQLVRITKRQSPSSFLKVDLELEFRNSLIDNKDQVICIYRLDEQEANALYKLLNPIVKQNKKRKQIKCLQCDKTYEFGTFDSNTATCTACGGFLFEYDIEKESLPEGGVAKSWTPSSVEDQMPDYLHRDAPEVVTSSNDSLKIYLHLNIIKGGADEQFVAILETGFLIYASAPETEKICHLMLTNKAFYLLAAGKKQPNEEFNFSIIVHHALAEITQVSIGLFYQLFQVELQTKTYVFLPREHTTCHLFINALRRFQKEACCPLNLAPAPVVMKSREFRDRIRSHILQDHPFELIYLYSMVFERQKTASASLSWNPLKHLGRGQAPVVPKTLIVSGEILVLCEEDFSHWPLLSSTKNPPPPYRNPQTYHLSDVISINLYRAFPKAFCIVFEIDKGQKKVREIWDLHCQSVEQRTFAVETISKHWKQLFRVELASLTL